MPPAAGPRRAAVVAVTKGRLDFGKWERIFYGEFDGRRRKRVLVKSRSIPSELSACRGNQSYPDINRLQPPYLIDTI